MLRLDRIHGDVKGASGGLGHWLDVEMSHGVYSPMENQYYLAR